MRWTSRSPWRTVAAIVVGLGLVGAAFWVPIPLVYGYLPGPVRDVEELVAIDGRASYSSEGGLFLTTVYVDPRVTFAELIVDILDPAKSIVTRESVTGGGSFKDLQRAERRQMAISQSAAKIVALSELGLATPTGNGAYVADVVGEPARGLIRRGDVIVAVDDETTDTLCEVGREIGEHRPGDEIRVTLNRDGRRRVVTVRASTSPTIPGRAFLGVAMRRNFDFEPGFDVDFETGRILGPSAGLMLTLALYDRLTPADLTAGREIAGTGTIHCDGSVGPIGGIEQKVAGAEGRGVEIFLAPAANFDAARSAADDLEVVPVETFDDALDYLNR
jgi:PDZ domain-containing protein